MRRSLYILVAALIIIGIFYSINRYIHNNTPQLDIPNFSDLEVNPEEISTASPAPIDLESDPIDQAFRTRLTEGAKEGPNFAGHYTIVEWGCGTMCSAFAIVDALTGQIYSVPCGTQAGLSFSENSRLLIINPFENIDKVYPGANLQPDWLTTQYYEWQNNELKLLSVYKLVNGQIQKTTLHEPSTFPNN